MRKKEIHIHKEELKINAVRLAHLFAKVEQRPTPSSTALAFASGKLEEAATQGRDVLEYVDRFLCSKTDPKVNIISYSLFGDDPKYCETLIINSEIYSDLYPDYKLFIYHDDSIPEHAKNRLRNENITLRNVSSIGISHWPGTFWRFYAFQEPGANYILFRDADSQLTQTEANWVKEWRNTNLPFHIIRDWYTHNDLILAGLWGGYAPFLAFLKEKIEKFIGDFDSNSKWSDQFFLAEFVWPIIKDFSLVHDGIHKLGKEPPKFVIPDNEKRPPLGRSYLRKYTCPYEPASSGSYIIKIITTTTGETIGTYYRKNQGNYPDEFFLPEELHQKIENRELSIIYMTSSRISPK